MEGILRAVNSSWKSVNLMPDQCLQRHTVLNKTKADMKHAFFFLFYTQGIQTLTALVAKSTPQPIP